MAEASVVVGESSTHGLGVFATRPLAAGEEIRVVNIVREIADEDPIRPEEGELVEHCAHPDGRVVLWVAPDRYLNHSCDPNAYEVYAADQFRSLPDAGSSRKRS